MKIELKNISHNERLSEETNAYSAVVFVDGVKWGHVSNHGTGGSDHQHPLVGGWDALKALNERIAAEYPMIDRSEYEMEPAKPDLESVCGDLITEFLIAKDLKRTMARKVLFKKAGAEGIYEVPLKQKGRLYPVEAIAKAMADKNPGAVILNSLPFDEALALFRKAA